MDKVPFGATSNIHIGSSNHSTPPGTEKGRGELAAGGVRGRTEGEAPDVGGCVRSLHGPVPSSSRTCSGYCQRFGCASQLRTPCNTSGMSRTCWDVDPLSCCTRWCDVQPVRPPGGRRQQANHFTESGDDFEGCVLQQQDLLRAVIELDGGTFPARFGDCTRTELRMCDTCADLQQIRVDLRT